MPSDADQSEEETLILDTVDQFLERDVRPYVREIGRAHV